MNKIMQGYVDLSAPAETTSIALNGLLKTPGKLTDIKYSYALDMKEEMKKSKDSEVRLLYSDTFSGVKKMDIRLSPINEFMTRLNYTVEKQTPLSKILVFVSFTICMLALFGIIITMCIADDYDHVSYVIIGFGLFMIFWLVLMLISLRTYSDKKIDKMIKTNFIERVVAYIEIVKSQNLTR